MNDQQHELNVIHLEILLAMAEQEAAYKQMLLLTQWKIARFQAMTGAGVPNA
jgi:hypothetical protein